MARRREATRDTVALSGDPSGSAPDEQLLVHSPKAASYAAKAQKESRRAARAERRIAEAERAARGGKDTASTSMTGAKVKRYIGIARILIPVLAPIAYQVAGAARAQWDDRRARRLGVAPEELSEFSGRGTALYARVHHLAVSTRDLQARRGDDAPVRAFAEDAGGRLSDLESAVRAAEQMPAARRRAAHIAVGAELDRLESRLLTLWGLDAPTRPDAPGSTRSA